MLHRSLFGRGGRGSESAWSARSQWFVGTLLAASAAACGDSGDDDDAAPKVSNAEIVTKVLVEGVQGGDTSIIRQYVGENYVQHGSLAPDGRSGLLAFAVLADKITYDIHRTLADGDYVALHSTYTFPDGSSSAVFDVFRLEAGLLVEHWDAVQAIPADPDPTSHGMTDGASEITDLDATEKNRALVQGFVQVVMEGGEITRASEFLSSDQFVQHDPNIEDGLAGFQAYMSGLADEGYAMKIQRSPIIVAQGNFVLVGSEGTAGAVNDQQYAIFYDLFREEGGRIVEHWDVVPPAPDPALLPHMNGYF